MELTKIFDSYISSINETRSPTTVSTYRCKLNTVAKSFQNMQVEDLTAKVAQMQFDNLSSMYSSKSIHGFLDVSKAAFSYAIKTGLANCNPFSEVCVGKIINHEPVILSMEETEMVLNAVSNDSALFLPILIAIETGLRRSQVLALTWADIDFSKGEIIVNKNVISSKNHVYTAGKERAVRSIQMSSRLASSLMLVMNSRRDNHVAVTATDYICLTKNLKTMEPTYFDKLFRAFIKEHQEIPQNLRFHDIRWSFINHEVLKGKDPMEIARAVGHKSCVFTMDYYYRYRQAA